MKLGEAWIESTAAEIREILAGDYDVREGRGVPHANQVAEGKNAVLSNLCTVSVDLRDSSVLLDQHQKQTAGKIHKAFLHTAASAFEAGGGRVRNFTGDGILAFWPADEKDEVQQAVDAVSFFTDAFRLYLGQEFAHYRSIDFGVGMDHGPIFILKAGLKPGQHNSDLVYIGPSVNFACRMAKQARSPSSLRMSPGVVANLRPDQVYDKPDAWIFKEQRVHEVSTRHKGTSYQSFERRDAQHTIVLRF